MAAKASKGRKNYFLSSVQLGSELMSLLGPEDHRFVYFPYLLDNNTGLIPILSKYRLFDERQGSLEIIQASGPRSHTHHAIPIDETFIMARYINKNEAVMHVLFVGDTKLEVAKEALEAAHRLYENRTDRKRTLVDTVVFLGIQDPDFSMSALHKTAAFQRLKETIGELPSEYLQFDDLLARAERHELSSGGNPPNNAFLDAAPPYERNAREKSVLIGNGINRLTDNSLAWTSVLKQLATTYSAPVDSVIANKTIPSPMKFECLADNVRTGFISNIFAKLKIALANIMSVKVTMPADIERGLCLPNTLYFLTTNYDENLEQCFINQGLTLSKIPNRDIKYLMNPTQRIDRATFTGTTVTTIDANEKQPVIEDGALLYHIHGSVDRPNTICIGYEHYMGYVSKLRGRLIRKSNDRENARHIIHLLLGTTQPYGTWEELFFRTDIAIIGLGLGYEESDIWELLTLRAAVLNTSDTLLSSGIDSSYYTNKIVYYDVELEAKHISETADSGELPTASLPFIDNAYKYGGKYELGKQKAFEALGVEVRVAHALTYEDGYKLILEELS